MRITGELAVAAAAVHLPPVVAGPAEGVREGFHGVTVSTGPTGPELAAGAVGKALAEAGVAPERVDTLVHAWASPEPEGVWTPAHRVARLAGARDAVALGVRQMSNGGAAALEAGLCRLLTEPGCRVVVTSTGDDFRSLPYDRWLNHPPLGDGGTAVVLTRGAGPQLVRSVATVGDPGLELLYPTADPFAAGTVAPAGPGSPALVRGFRRLVGIAVARALADAGLEAGDPGIRAVLLPRLGRTTTRLFVLPGLPEVLRDLAVGLGARTGHLGAGDLPANLAEHPPPPAGGHHLLLSTGAGLTVTAVVTTGR
ncbi:3-oxoacyl-[acyl-carrier-protein] synthase-3 [Crossiella equi]|uniref:3-oxoacyl-[acyl-carrier-protein] synthase-3 n=1 Tax=Crossiella equi TaxID=130796 RepID=A0ABS5A5T5_9PSEU|nr:hypothetical protein [Crossiella equi]MBP2471945.1 3-oxoacyl-[acyl-carrier-protein] synthase-3 [Crossiella equi]